MGSYTLSGEADADVQSIAEESVKRWGESRSVYASSSEAKTCHSGIPRGTRIEALNVRVLKWLSPGSMNSNHMPCS
jgi:hypothetical protein